MFSDFSKVTQLKRPDLFLEPGTLNLKSLSEILLLLCWDPIPLFRIMVIITISNMGDEHSMFYSMQMF